MLIVAISPTSSLTEPEYARLDRIPYKDSNAPEPASSERYEEHAQWLAPCAILHLVPCDNLLGRR